MASGDKKSVEVQDIRADDRRRNSSPQPGDRHLWNRMVHRSQALGNSVGRRKKISLTILRVKGRRHWRFAIDTIEQTGEAPVADACNL